MIDVKGILDNDKSVNDYRIVETKQTSYELFFVKTKLETVRATDTTSSQVTVYIEHDGYLGDSTFNVYESTTEEDLGVKTAKAIERAKLVFNKPYVFPERQVLLEELPSDISSYDEKTLGQKIANAVFTAEKDERCSLSAVEIFIYCDTQRVLNSRGVDKTQIKRKVMIEAIPTFTDDNQSVELYEDYRFTYFDEEKLKREISAKMKEVKDRAMAKKISGGSFDVYIRGEEISQLVSELAYATSYGAVYSHSTPLKIGDDIQSGGDGDKINLTMTGVVEGSERSSLFDEDGAPLIDTQIIQNGKIKANYGSVRFGQYLGIKKPTGNLPCARLEKGSLTKDELKGKTYIECAFLSGLQVDIFSDYIGGEIRLAYLCDENGKTPITSISMSAKLSEVLKSLRLTNETDLSGNYYGPVGLLMKDVSIF